MSANDESPATMVAPRTSWLDPTFGGSASRIGTDIMDKRPYSGDAAPGAIDLRAGIGSWPLRHQGGSVLCIAYAVAACLELAMVLKQSPVARKLAMNTDMARPAGFVPLVPERLSAGFLHHCMFKTVEDLYNDERAAKSEDGGMWFTYAISALTKFGISTADAWADTSDPRRRPSSKAKADAEKRVVQDLKDIAVANDITPQDAAGGSPKKDIRPILPVTHINDLILGELRNGRPVAVAFPVYADQYGITSWQKASEKSGTVGFPDDPAGNDHIGGHAVCIVGYQPDTNPPSNQDRPSGGWFIFRNSFGQDWGRQPIRDEKGKQITGDGYGRIALRDMLHCWDIFALGDAAIPAVPPPS